MSIPVISSGYGDPDFSALAMESESLLSHIPRPNGLPLLNKNLAEIERGSWLLGAEAKATGQREALALGTTPHKAEQRQERKGMILLSRKRFDPEALERDVDAVQLQGQYQPLQPLGETDIEGYLAHHHDMIMVTAVEETRRAAEESALIRQREWEGDTWRAKKKARKSSLYP
ncbi:unnamed protein product [Choristocarpus tenellus]